MHFAFGQGMSFTDNTEEKLQRDVRDIVSLHCNARHFRVDAAFVRARLQVSAYGYSKETVNRFYPKIKLWVQQVHSYHHHCCARRVTHGSHL
jgi:hypothetical protein